jgi:hypothetical protein
MRRTPWAGSVLLAAVAILSVSSSAQAIPVYLNFENIDVILGPSMPAEPFSNRTTAASLASIIDAPSADASELHNQSTHVWTTNRTLELIFDFRIEYDLTDLHFWNYHSEGFDVDNIVFTFRNAANAQVGTLTLANPVLGGGGSGSDSIPIFADDYVLSFPSRVRYVTAQLTGSNGQVDFNNIGFTAEESEPSSRVPEPTTVSLLALGFAGAAHRAYSSRRRRGQEQ